MKPSTSQPRELGSFVACPRNPDSDAPVLTTAIHELGLDLKKSKGGFDVLVVDRLGKLSENQRRAGG
jgi:uncharacterized protein (TIGR03435 family)